MSAEEPTRPFRRRVFYIPGFDPYAPRRYRELYRREGTKQAEISGYDLKIKGRSGADIYGWNIRTVIDGTPAQTRYEVLGWRDLVQNSMNRSILGTYWQLVTTLWTYLRSGALMRLSFLRKGPVIAALYPVAVLTLQFVMALWAGLFVAGLVSSVTWPGVGLIAGLPLFVFLLRWFRNQDRRFFAYYLMQDYAYTASRKGAYPPELEDRLNAFRARIVAALASDVDEVLVVGHSSGAHLAVSIFADMQKAHQIPENGPKLALLTLGQVVPMVSFLPKAMRLRADLNRLSQCKDIFWLDVSAPGDGCCFALCDPVAVSGVSPPVQRWPLVLSAAFTNTLSPELWQALKRRFYRLHFQYLCAFDRPGDYDYFQITAGAVPLAERFQFREPSQSRIDVPASPHVSMLP